MADEPAGDVYEVGVIELPAASLADVVGGGEATRAGQRRVGSPAAGGDQRGHDTDLRVLRVLRVLAPRVTARKSAKSAKGAGVMYGIRAFTCACP